MAAGSTRDHARWVLVGLTAVLVVATVLIVTGMSGADVSAGAPATGPTPEPHGAALPLPNTVYGWSATSPATHEGDTYTLALTNGATAQRIRVRVVIMDHAAGVNPLVLDERVDLAAGEQLVLTAVNDYGPANHFNTRIVSEQADLTFEVSVTDASDERVAWFNERAFMQRAIDPAAWLHRDEPMLGHDHDHDDAS